jgi:metal-sulfur cluster biosynthetic enzyme
MPPMPKRPSEPAARPLKDEVIEVLKNTRDPELGIDIHTLGLIRKIQINPEKEAVLIQMTLTTPLCPYGPQIMKDVETGLRNIGLKRVKIELVFDPPWQPSPEVRLMLGV